jgi:DNA invertase Pin-like site-specific DNA recombinase
VLLQVPNLSPEFFLEQIRESERTVSEADRIQLLLQLYMTPASNYRSPGVDALGQQRMRTIGYLRNSVGKLDISTSIPRQLERFLEYCARMKLVPIGVHADPDTSGATVLQRAGLMRMLLQVRAGLVDVITAEDPDRIGRAMSAIGLTWDTIRRHNVPLINLRDGKPLTDESILIHGFVAASEHAKIKSRTRDGITRKTRNSDAITKHLAHGHYREYKRGPVLVHPGKSRARLEACQLYVAGLTTGQLAATFNNKFRAGDQDYMPPYRPRKNGLQKEPIWKHCHFITGSKAMSGLLENEQGIGKFHHESSIHSPDPLSGNVKPEYPDRDTLKPVERPDLAFIPLELWKAVRERADADKASRARQREEKDKDRSRSYDQHQQGSAGKRRLLSGIVTCGLCGEKFTFLTWKGKLVITCSGRVTRRCKKGFLINVETLQNKLVDAFEQEITSRGSLDTYAEKRQMEFDSIIEDLKKSQSDLEDRLAVLRDDLIDTRAQIRKARSKAGKSVFEEEQNKIQEEMKDIEDKLELIEVDPKPEPLRKDEATRTRGLLHRLRDPNVGFSDGPDDMWIVQRFRKVVRAVTKPNQHDYGVAVHVELDFVKFFQPLTAAGPIGAVTCRFIISIPPHINRHRRVNLSAINVSMLKGWEKYPMPDAMWKEVANVMKPCAEMERRVPTLRKHYQAFFVSLRAGAGPTSRHIPDCLGQRASKITSVIRKFRLWPKFERILRKYSQNWVDQIDPGHIAYLNLVPSESNPEWKITFVDG